MASNTPLGNSPWVWRPTRKPANGPACQVRAGDWIMVDLIFLKDSTPVLYEASRFLVHVLYTPNTDDSQFQRVRGHLQPTMYGGDESKTRSEYHIDPGWSFQCPFDGQLQVVAGSTSPDTCQLGVVVRRANQPDEIDQQAVASNQELRDMLEFYGLPPPAVLGIMELNQSRRAYAPPVIGSPAMVPSTYIDIPAGRAIPFTSGAVALQVTGNMAITPAPVPVTLHALGQVQRISLASGRIEQLGALAQGGAGSNGIPATWESPTDLYRAVVWSRLGV